MLALYDIIYGLISPFVDTYADGYPKEKEVQEGTKIYPYAEFSFSNSYPGNEYSDLNWLQVDIWDNKSGQVQEIETIADNIYKALNKVNIKTDNVLIQIYRNTPCRLKLADPDVNIQRRELKFIIKTYERN